MDGVKVYKQTKYTSNNRVVQYLNRVYLRNITRLVQLAQPARLPILALATSSPAQPPQETSPP